MASSMAKAFGVPLAVLSGSEEIVERFETESETRTHCSPPSVATVHAAEHALRLNRDRGDAARLRLSCLVRHFRSRLEELGLAATGGLFPVQMLAPVAGADAATIHERLLRSGVRAVLHYSRHDSRPRLSFLITARHTPAQLDRAAEQLSRVGENFGPAEANRPAGRVTCR
jgi:8-amino-7-oxononanoate synthase